MEFPDDQATKKRCFGDTAVMLLLCGLSGTRRPPVKIRPKTKNQIQVVDRLLQDVQNQPLQMIRGYLEPKMLNTPTRTMLTVMVETSMSNFKRRKTKYGNATTTKEFAAATAKLHFKKDTKPAPGAQSQPFHLRC
jgi:hypothetical protein